jgi:hydroxymethylpyrimidine pyrophosphatase-like HAD family hydrolase
MKRFVFTDLDNTIVRHQSRIADVDIRQIQIVGTDEFGNQSTIMTKADLEFFQEISHFGTVIPTTGRSVAGYWRLHGLVPGFTSWAILNHGATILMPEDSKVDPDWLERTKGIMARLANDLLEVYKSLLFLNTVVIENCCYTNTIRLHQEHGFGLYISVRASRVMPELHLIQQRHTIALLTLEQNDFELLHTGRITSVIPRQLNKKDAVLEVIRRLGDQIETLGVGDALTDLPFMQVCNFQRAPENSEIQRIDRRV